MTRMGKKVLFFVLLGVVLVFIYINGQPIMLESFVNSNPTVNVPKTNPSVTPLGKGDPQPFSPPSTALLAPPPGQTASVNSYPAKDPALQKATIKRIKGAYESISGFMKNEVKALENLSDPSVKLPLESLKADYRRLEDEKLVLTKNPGIESTLTELDINGIEANLRYLQQKWRLSANSATVEGFQGGVPGFGNLGPTGPTGGTFNFTDNLGTGSTGSTGSNPLFDMMNATGSTGATGGTFNFTDNLGTGPTGSNPLFNMMNATGPTGATGSDSRALKSTIEGLKINLDYSTLGAVGSATYNQFVNSFITDIARSLNIPTNRIRVESLLPGSIIVNFIITPGTPNAQELAILLITLIRNTSSSLYSGTITRSIDSTVIPTTSNTFVTDPPPADTGSTGDGGGGGSGGSALPNAPASLYQLRDLVRRINVEITRLKRSGTSDPIITKRVDLLNDVRLSVVEIIRQVENSEMEEIDIPILQSSYYAFLPIMSNLNSPLPNIIKKSGLSDVFNSLFPLYGAGDISGAQLARSIFDQYTGDFLNNMSWNLNLKYTGKAETDIAKEIASGLGKSVIGTAPSTSTDTGNTFGEAPSTEYRGMFDSLVKQQVEGPAGHTGHTGHTGVMNTPPSKLDWKTRSRQICEQITRRGLNQYDYGCMKDTKSVSETFSFRGYAKMICNRLSTNYDPGIPELCGCPPPTWAGWRG